MLKSFIITTLVAARALADFQQPYTTVDFGFQNGTGLSLKHKNIKVDQYYFAGELVLNMQIPNPDSQQQTEKGWLNNVELGVCIEFPDYELEQPAYDCVRVQFNIDYKEDTGTFKINGLNREDGIVMSKEEIGKKDAFKTQLTVGGEEKGEEDDWRGNVLDVDDELGNDHLGTCSLALDQGAADGQEGTYVINCDEVMIQIQRAFTTSDTEDHLDIAFDQNDTYKPREYNVIAWSQFYTKHDFSDLLPKWSNTSEAASIQIVDDDVYEPSDAAKEQYLFETVQNFDNIKMNTVEVFKSMGLAKMEEIKEWEKWFANKNIKLEPKDQEEYAELELEVQYYQTELTNMLIDLQQKMTSLILAVEEADPAQYDDLLQEIHEAQTEAADSMADWLKKEKTGLEEIGEDCSEFLRTLRDYWPSTEENKEGAISIMAYTATLVVAFSALMF